MTTQSTPQSPLPIGAIISDKYRVERIVGKGGMGIVFAARHIKLDEPVAIKLMLSDDLGNRESVERFLREARACAKLKNSEHVVRVTDVDTMPNGLPYMVMELLDGQDLDKLLKERGVFAIHDACSYVMQACRALGDAHKIGIIHRDLKPQNLFLARREDGSACIKVLDFGISKHTLMSESASIDLTRPFDILGSAYYMSPEQAQSSRTVVPQSDIYSLGAVLYKLLTGRAPFPRKTLLEVYEALLTETPALPSQFRKELPQELENIILRCLDKTIRHRFSNTHELMAALAPFTVPGEASKVDDTDSDSITTIPRTRGPNLSSLGGTIPLGQVHNSGLPLQAQATRQTHSGHEQRDPQGISFQTQPLDAKSLQAALHSYLPPRAITHRAATSPPQLSRVSHVSGEGPTPQMTHRIPVKPPAVVGNPTTTPLPSFPASRSTNPHVAAPSSAHAATSLSTNAVAVHETIYVSSVAHVMGRPMISPNERLPLETPDTTMTPWNTFPAVARTSNVRVRVLFLAGVTIVLFIVLLVWKFLS